MTGPAAEKYIFEDKQSIYNNYVEGEEQLQKINFDSNGKTQRRVPEKKLASQAHSIKQMKNKLKFGLVEKQIIFENEYFKFIGKQKKNKL